MRRLALALLATGCGGAPSTAPTSGACPAGPADGTPPPVFAQAIGPPGGDMFVRLVAAEAAGADIPAPGRWIVWDAGGDGAAVDDAAALAAQMTAATGHEATPGTPRDERLVAATARWSEGDTLHVMALEAAPAKPGRGGTYACRLSPDAAPFRLADARAVLPAFAPADLLSIVSEAVAQVPIANIEARAGEESGGEVGFDVVADAAWKRVLEERLLAASDQQIPFKVEGADGVAYLHEEPQWKVDVHDLPGGRVHVEVDWY